MQKGYDIKKNKFVQHVKWGDIPYHFFVNKNGAVAEGRELRFAAGSNTIYKTPIENHITVVLDGNFEASEPTPSQLRALTNLLERLAKQYNIRLGNISSHKSVAVEDTPTICPGEKLLTQIPEIKRELIKRGIT